jgi:hypothetical protein
MAGGVSGPKCGKCGFRPDDPVWARAAGSGSRRVLCLGCVADARRAGARLLVTERTTWEGDLPDWAVEVER